MTQQDPFARALERARAYARTLERTWANETQKATSEASETDRVGETEMRDTQDTALVTMSAHSRRWGMGWTSEPIRTPDGELTIEPVEAPETVGTKGQVLRALERAARINQGNAWRFALFADGQRVILGDLLGRVQEARYLLDTRGPITVRVKV